MTTLNKAAVPSPRAAAALLGRLLGRDVRVLPLSHTVNCTAIAAYRTQAGELVGVLGLEDALALITACTLAVVPPVTLRGRSPGAPLGPLLDDALREVFNVLGQLFYPLVHEAVVMAECVLPGTDARALSALLGPPARVARYRLAVTGGGEGVMALAVHASP